MCRICSCSEIGICLGNITYVIERLSSCIAATAVVICLMSTLMIMLGMGIGLGYNYCYVDTKLNETLKAAKAYKKTLRGVVSCTGDITTEIITSLGPSPTRRDLGGSDNFPATEPSFGPKRMRRSKDQILNRVSQNLEVPSSTQTTLEVRPTMVVPLKHFALMILIKDLQKMNKNFTLELIAARIQ